MVKNQKFLRGLLLGGFTLLGLLVWSPNQADAATLAVDNNCTMNEAVTAINAAADGSGCIKTDAAYGTDDKITLSTGTVTLAADLPTLTTPVTISGTGINQSIIDADGHSGISANYTANNPLQQDIVVENLTIKDASLLAISIFAAKSVTLDNVEVKESAQGVLIYDAIEVTVNGSNIHHNTDPVTNGQTGSGIYIRLQGRISTDIVSIDINNSSVSDNKSMGGVNSTGLLISVEEATRTDSNVKIAGKSVTLHNVSILRNEASSVSGIYLNESGGPTATVAMDLLVDATTVAYNKVIVPTAVTVDVGEAHAPVIAGVFLSGKLTDQQNFTNATVAYNTVENPAPDNRNTIAGIFGSMSINGASLRITNATVVGNSVNQPGQYVTFPAFLVIKADIDLSGFPTVVINDVQNGSSSQNSLIAHNIQNGDLRNCLSTVDLMPLFGYAGTIDATPTNLGNNLTDDLSCTGYNSAANLYDTIDHEVKDNGGPVPTIALLPGSPAINAGGVVLGISTDARGVARTGYISVGAYQGVLLAASTTNSAGGGSLAETGVVAISAGALLTIFVIGLAVVFADYRRHKKPLKAVDPKVQYGFLHHVSVVTIPLLRYRLFIRVSKKDSYSATGVHKF